MAANFIKKKIVLVDRGLQLRFSGAAVFVGGISTLLTACLLLVPLFWFEILHTPRFLPIPMFVAMFVAAGLNAVMIGVLGVYMTHRISGPIFSIVRFVRILSQGFFTERLQLRQGDELGFLVRALNGAAADLCLKSQKSLEDLLVIRQSLSQLESSQALEEARIKLDELIEAQELSLAQAVS